MRGRLSALVLGLLFAASGAAFGSESPLYYVALGDSLAVGFQPSTTGGHPTNHGYVDDLYALARLRLPGLQLLKLGCAGETSATMVNGGICSYAPFSSQLDESIAFLVAHPHQVAFVTVDIGSNDVDHCYTLNPLAVAQGCFQTGLSATVTYLSHILLALRGAAPGVPIIGMNYFNPFLAGWELFPGPVGQTFAIDSELAADAFNNALDAVYSSFEVPVADVASAFHSDDFSPVPVLGVPLNVFLVLTWTWMGAPPPLGPDVHPNVAGYGVIAAAFIKAFQGK